MLHWVLMVCNWSDMQMSIYKYNKLCIQNRLNIKCLRQYVIRIKMMLHKKIELNCIINNVRKYNSFWRVFVEWNWEFHRNNISHKCVLYIWTLQSFMIFEEVSGLISNGIKFYNWYPVTYLQTILISGCAYYHPAYTTLFYLNNPKVNIERGI